MHAIKLQIPVVKIKNGKKQGTGYAFKGQKGRKIGT
jgi:hypothetical protein